ncbi:MAG: HAD-IB family hydrolase [Clostridium sp.]
MKKKLAIFDVDYTLTKKETLMELFKYVALKEKKNMIYIPRALFSGLMFVAGIYDEKKVKETFLKFLHGRDEENFRKLIKSYYDERLSKILYEDGMNMLKKLKNEGYDVYLISASPEFYLMELYAIKEVDVIIGTKFSFEEGKFARRMVGANCKGEEKVRRLKEYLKENNVEVDYEESYMFSDSLSDKPLLDLVGKPYLINYKKKGDYEILNWR